LKIFVAAVVFSVFICGGEVFNFRPLVYADEDEFLQQKANHFIINYDKDVDKNYVSDVRNVAEKFYRILTQEFRFIRSQSWLWEKRTKIFIAKDKDDFLDRFDCSSWSGACVNYRDKIIYSYPDQKEFSSILVHELTHIIFHEYVGRDKLPAWLDEGIATYMEDKYGNQKYRRSLPALKRKIKSNSHIDFPELNAMSPEELNDRRTDYITTFYVESYSIVNFIIEKYGKYRFSNFLSSLRGGYTLAQSVAKISYELKSLEKLEKKWEEFYQE